MAARSTRCPANTHAHCGQASKKYEASAPLWHQAGDSYEECLALNEAGRILQTIGDLNKAEELERRALEFARSNRRAGTSRRHDRQYRPDRAHPWKLGGKRMRSFLEALPYTRQAGDRGIEGSMLSNIGYALEGLGQWPEALDYDKQASSVLLETGQFAQASSTTLQHVGVSISN